MDWVLRMVKVSWAYISDTYLLYLRSTSFSLAATTTDDIVAFDTEDDEGMGWDDRFNDRDAMQPFIDRKA